MNRRTKTLLWVGLVLSLPASGYAGLSFIYFAWLSGADPVRWPAGRAAAWAYSALGIGAVFLGLFAYCLVALVKDANRLYREKRGADLE